MRALCTEEAVNGIFLTYVCRRLNVTTGDRFLYSCFNSQPFESDLALSCHCEYLLTVSHVGCWCKAAIFEGVNFNLTVNSKSPSRETMTAEVVKKAYKPAS